MTEIDIEQLLTPKHLTGNPVADITAFLVEGDRQDTVAHLRAVAEEAERLARRFGVDPAQARLAGWLHDVAAVVPASRVVEAAEGLGIVLTPADRAIPQVIHGRISAWLGQRWFGVTDPLVLDAVRCHTTLRYGATDLDKTLFVADKTALDPTADFQPGYRVDLDAALDQSLDHAAFTILDWFVRERDHLSWRLHPDLLAAHAELADRLDQAPAAWGEAEARVKWDGQGLVPAIVQDADTGAVLTLAYMNRTALMLTLATGETHFWSRSRREIWHKGRTSGHTQAVVDLRLDCDGDAVLVRVHPHGPACHTGANTCFFASLYQTDDRLATQPGD